MNILLFAPQGPNAGAEGMVTDKTARLLRKAGHKVIWLYDHVSYVKDTAFNSDDDNFLVDPKKDGGLIENILVFLGNQFRISFFEQFAWCLASCRVAKRIMKENSIDFNMVISRIMPKYGHLPALLFCRKRETPWVLSWSDPLPHYMAPPPYGRGNETELSIFDHIYLSLLTKRGDAHIFPSERLKAYMMKYFPHKCNNTYIIPHFISSEELTEGRIQEAPENLLRMLHIGACSSPRNPIPFIKALAKLKDEESGLEDKLTVDFVGSYDDIVCKQASELGLTDIVHFMPAVPHEEAMHQLRRAHVGIVIEANMTNGIFLPSKVADIVTAKIPMLALSPKEGVMSDIISNFGGGLLADVSSEQSIYDTLKEILQDWKEIKLVSDKYNLERLSEYLSSTHVLHTYETMFQEITN